MKILVKKLTIKPDGEFGHDIHLTLDGNDSSWSVKIGSNYDANIGASEMYAMTEAIERAIAKITIATKST